MRPKKTRWVKCDPGERCFRPRCVREEDLEGVVVSLDEFEVLRLSDFESLPQIEVARRMNVHRSTVSRMLGSARRKVSEALVCNKAIKIEGGCCKIVGDKG